jgi:hypothetical protein
MALEGGKTIRIVPDQPYLAVDSTDSLFKTLSVDEFHQCERIDELFTCPNMNKYDRRTKDNCLISLYKSDHEGIHSHCRVVIDQEEDYVEQLNSTTFVLFSAQQQQLERVCVKHKSRGESSSVITQGLTKVHLPPGCKAITPSFIFEADENVFGDPSEVSFRLVDLDRMMGNLSSRIGDFSLKDLELINSREGLSLPAAATEIAFGQQHETYKQHTETFKWRTLIMLLVSLVLSLLSLLCIVIYCSRKCAKSYKGDAEKGYRMFVIPKGAKVVAPECPEAGMLNKTDSVS